jgi:hypothetical protein
MMVLKLLEEKQLYMNPFKCAYGVQEVEYLGHIIFHEGVKVDPNKIRVVVERPILATPKNLRGFLGLKFFIESLLRTMVKEQHLLQKNNVFAWT